MTPKPSANSLKGRPWGSEWTLLAIEGPTLLVERLYEMGFLPGETVRLAGKVAFGGPWVIEVRGMTVALREKEAECLRI